MSTAPSEIEVVDLSLFEEFEIPCEVPQIVGDSDQWCCDYNAAEWIAFRSIVCKCGIITRLVCTDCKVKYQELMAQFAHLYCPTCEEETNGFDRFEPLVHKS